MASEDTNIASLSLNVKSSTASAEKGLDNLKKTLEKLKSIATGKSLGLKGLRELSESLNKLKSASGGIKLSAIATGISKIKASLEGIGENATQITDLANSIDKLSGAFRNIEPISNVLKDIKKSVKNTKVIDPEKLEAYKPKIEPKESGGEPLRRTSEYHPPASISNEIDGLEEKANNLKTTWNEAFEIIKNNASSFVKDIKDKTSNAVQNFANLPSTIANAFSEIPTLIKKNSLSSELENYNKQFAAMQESLLKQKASTEETELKLLPLLDKISETRERIDELSQSSQNAEKVFGKLGNAFSKFGGVVSTVSKNIVKIPFKILERGFEGVKNSINKGINSIRTFLTSLGRIAMYRSVRAVLKLISDGIREGTSNAYQFSKATGGELSKNLDRISTSMLFVKNSIGAAVTPLINALAPAIEFVTSKFVGLVNYINQSFASLSGQDYWLKAKTYAVEYAEAANKSSKSNTKFADAASKSFKKMGKELKKSTIGIDELNILEKTQEKIPKPEKPKIEQPPKMDYSQMFEKVPIENKIKDSLRDIKKYIKNQDFEGLGRELGNKFNKAMNNIDFENFGGRIGKVINASVDTAYAFLKTADPFTKLGRSLAKTINGLLDKTNFNKLGRTIANAFLGLPKFVVGLVEKLDFSKVTSKLSDALIGIFDEASEWLESIDWNKFGFGLGKNIWSGVKNIKYIEIAQSFGRLIWNIVKTGFEFVPSIASGLLQSLVTDLLGNMFNIGLDEKTKNKIGDIGKQIALGIIGGIIFGPLGAFLFPQLEGLIKMIKDFFGIKSPSKKMSDEVGKPLADGILKGFTNGIEALKTFFKNAVGNITKWVTEGVPKAFETGKKICNSFLTGVSNTYRDTKTVISNWAENVKRWFTGGEGQNNIATKFGTYAKLITTRFAKQMQDSYVSTRDVVKKWSNSTHMWFLEKELLKKFEITGASLPGYFKKGVEGNVGQVQNYMNGVAINMHAPFSRLPNEFKKSGEDSFNGYMRGFDEKFNAGMERLKKYGPAAINAWNAGLKIHSPSKLFIQSGEYSMEGYNIGIKNKMGETEEMLKTFSNSLSKNLKTNIEIDTPPIKDYTKEYSDSISTEVNSKSSVNVSSFGESIKEFYKTELLPIIVRIATDTRRQADKDEKTILRIGNRTIEEAVATQKKANGYRFLVES